MRRGRFRGHGEGRTKCELATTKGVAVPERLHLYEVRIQGAASEVLRAAFDDVDVTVESGQTVLRTDWADATVLYGLLSRLETLGLVLLEAKATEANAFGGSRHS